MKITVKKWLKAKGNNPADAGLIVYTGRPMIPRQGWGNILIDESAQLVVRLGQSVV